MPSRRVVLPASLVVKEATRGQHEASGKTIALNSILNLSTASLLLLLNILVIPLVLREYGLELFGVMSVTWMILANLSWLDLGLSRATANFAAKDLGKGDRKGAANWVRISGRTLLIIGVLGGIAIFVAAPFLVARLNISAEREEQVILSLRMFAFAMPVDFVGRCLVGAMQACQRFRWLNGNDLAVGTLTVAAYGAAALFGGSFLFLTGALLAVRFLAFGINLVGVARALPEVFGGTRAPIAYTAGLKEMTRFGAWLSLAALVGALLLYFDRWLIGFMLSAAMLAYYAVPMSLMIRLHLVPGSIASTFFPAVSTLLAQGKADLIDDYWIRSNRFIAILVIPSTALMAVWASPLLTLWLGPEFARIATPVLQIICLGFAIGLFAPLSAAVLEGAGRPDIVGKIYLLLLPLNLVTVWFFVSRYGLVGAAFSFFLRATVETAFIVIMLYRSAPWITLRSARRIRHDLSVIVLLTLAAATAVLVQDTIVAGVAWSFVSMALCGFVLYRVVLDDQDRATIAETCGRVLRKFNDD